MKTLHIKNNVKLAVAAFAAMAVLTACEATFYDEEQYRKEIYLVSNESNIFGQEYSFGGESVGYLSVYAGGTTPIEKDVEVELEVYPDYLRNYNQRVYGENYSNYAQELNPADYYIESFKTTLKADSSTPYTMFPIKVNVDNLSTEENYYIPIRIKSVSDYMISEEKQNMLFRIYVKNDYATTKSTTYFTMNGTEQSMHEENGEWVPEGVATGVNSTKVFTPISENGIRMLSGSTYSTASSVIRNQSVSLTVHPDELIDVPVLVEGIHNGEYVKRQKVTIDTWMKSSSAIEVADVDGELNYYDPDKQTFTLHYRYKLPTETSWHFMYEVLTPLNITNK